MKCLTCGCENADGTVQCASCGELCPASAVARPTVAVKISPVAIASTVLALVALVFLLPGLIAHLDPRSLHPQSGVATLTGMVTLLATGLAFLLGIIGLLLIATSGGRWTGYGFAAIGAGAPFGVFVALIYLPAFGGFKFSTHVACGTNLSGIGKAILIYANECDDKLPRAGGRGARWGPGLLDWAAESRAEAFGLGPDGTGGRATVGSIFYLLVRYSEVQPRTFVCKGERGMRPFDPDCYLPDRELTALWDFGPDPARHCSYAYRLPHDSHWPTTSDAGGMVLAADRNPWLDGPVWKATDFARFQWDGTVRQQRAGNAVAHWLDGQNVLFLDSHAEFIKRPYHCTGQSFSAGGIDRRRVWAGDNIYTCQDGGPIQQGRPPEPYQSRPTSREDTLLVSDPPLRDALRR